MDGLPIYSGGLELRDAGDGSRRLSGRFPYNSRAVINSGGNGQRPRKEVFAPRAFGFAVDDPDRDIHFLIGHSYDRPLASKKAQTFLLNDTDIALEFEAIITPDIQVSSWWTDFLATFGSGLVGGISPGFRVAPRERVRVPEKTEDEDPSEGTALIRTIFAAVLFELSLVTRPAYPETALDLRQLDSGLILPTKKPAAYRWR